MLNNMILANALLALVLVLQAWAHMPAAQAAQAASHWELAQTSNWVAATQLAHAGWEPYAVVRQGGPYNDTLVYQFRKQGAQ